MAWLLGLLVCSVASPARADSYSWGGSSGRFRVEVFRSGFDEGAGEGGWDEDSARDFAAWARRFNVVIPAGVLVSLAMDVSDDDTTLTFRRGARLERVALPGTPDFDAALALVARRFGAHGLPPPSRGRLFTLQLFASRSEANAARFAASVEARGVRAEHQFFHQECHPCSIPEARVLEPSGGVWRVVTGIYDRSASARRALTTVRRKWKLAGFVREL